MDKADRRSNPRYDMKIPIRFRELEDLKDPEGYTAETTDISRNGLFFMSKVSLPLGSMIQMALRVPRELSGSATSEVRCLGRIVRTEIFADGSAGYGTRIDLRQSAGSAGVAKKNN